MLNLAKQSIKSVGYAALQAVLPARCPVSGDVVSEPGLVSPDVWAQLDFIASPLCSCCGLRFDIPLAEDTLCPECLTEPPEFDQARTVLAYNEPSRAMILAFKHGDQTHLITSFVPWLERAGGIFKSETDVIMPVPLHRWRLMHRRFNQASLLGQGLARAWNIQFDARSLSRTRATASQGHMTRAQRHDNVSGAFAVAEKYRGNVQGKNVLLIDDVFTTGATVVACAKALKRAGAVKVNVLTLARVLRSV
jgi:ComF family protein